jgi:hypothetical protein
LATYPQLMPRLRKSETLLLFLQMHLRPRPPRAVSGPVEEIFLGPRRKDIPAKNIYTKSDRLTASCQMNRAWCERFNLYHRQKVMLPRKKKTNSGSGARTPAIFTDTPPPISSALFTAVFLKLCETATR